LRVARTRERPLATPEFFDAKVGESYRRNEETHIQQLACTDPKPMLKFLEGMVGSRKLRLFAVACCRRIWDLLKDERSRKAVEVAELAIEGQATIAQRTGSVIEAGDACAIAEDELTSKSGCEEFSASYAGYFTAVLDVMSLGRTPETVTITEYVSSHAAQARNNDGERDVHTALLRDIFANPFRPLAVDHPHRDRPGPHHLR